MLHRFINNSIQKDGLIKVLLDLCGATVYTYLLSLACQEGIKDKGNYL